MNLDGASFQERANSSNKGQRTQGNNQTISHLMKNLELIKNINKQNRIGSQERRRSLSSQKRYKSGDARSVNVVSPNHSQSKSFDIGKQN